MAAIASPTARAGATSPPEVEGASCLNLHHAASIGSLQQCKYFLDSEGVDVNSLNAYDESALYCARGARAAQYTFDGERVVYAALTDDIRRLLRAAQAGSALRVQAPLHTHLARLLNEAGAESTPSAHHITFAFFPSPAAVPAQLPVWVDASMRGAGGAVAAATPFPPLPTGHTAQPLTAHRIILAARSPTMRSLLTGPWAGALTVAVVGGPPHREIIRALTQFAYTDSLQTPWSHMVPLRRLASRLTFRRLRHAITAHVKSRPADDGDSTVTRLTSATLLGAGGTVNPTATMLLDGLQMDTLPSHQVKGGGRNLFKAPPALAGAGSAALPAAAAASTPMPAPAAAAGSLESDFDALATGVLQGLHGSGVLASTHLLLPDGGAPRPAHLELFAARSEFFAALFSPMFAEGASEEGKGGISLQDLPPAAATALVRFVYAGAGVQLVSGDGAPCHAFKPGHLAAALPPSPLTADELVELLVASDRLLMPDLRALAASAATAGVHLQCAVPFYRAADAFGLRSLSQQCASVMARHLHVLVVSPPFLSLVAESAASISDRQATDSIPVLDDIAAEMWTVQGVLTAGSEAEETRLAALALASWVASGEGHAAAAKALALHPLHVLNTGRQGFTTAQAAVDARRSLLHAVTSQLGLAVFQAEQT